MPRGLRASTPPPPALRPRMRAGLGGGPPRPGPARGGWVPAPGPGARRVVAKVSYREHAALRDPARALAAHAAYLTREAAGEGGRAAEAFDAAGPADAAAAVARWAGDARHFRLVLAPEDGAAIADMAAFARAVMARAAADLGTRLEWVAAVHEKADRGHAANRHAHVLLRGVDDRGAPLRLGRDWVRHGLRHRAGAEATALLGRDHARAAPARQRPGARGAGLEAGEGTP